VGRLQAAGVAANQRPSFPLVHSIPCPRAPFRCGERVESTVPGATPSGRGTASSDLIKYFTKNQLWTPRLNEIYNPTQILPEIASLFEFPSETRRFLRFAALPQTLSEFGPLIWSLTKLWIS
jgi:hypothetical protein